MWWFATKKGVKKSFKKYKEEIKELKQTIISKDKIDLMIREAFDRERLKVREHNPRTPRTIKRKKADKLLDKAEIMSEIGSMLKNGLSTTEIHHQIVEVKGYCKKTCFYKYMKAVREQFRELREPTPRTE